MASYTQAALVAQAAAATTSTPAPAPVQEKIPPSMAKFIDVEAEIPVTSVQLDGLVGVILPSTSTQGEHVLRQKIRF